MDKINIADYGLKVGSKLPLSLYDRKGKLLYKQGQEITAEAQIERLKRMDLYGVAESAGRYSAQRKRTAAVTEQIHPFAQLSAIELKLRNIMNGLDEGKASTKGLLEKLSKEVYSVIKSHPDIALGYCHWPYNDRAGLHQAIICSLLAASAAVALGIESQKILSMISGSMMQNASSWDYQLQLNGLKGPLTEGQKKVLHKHPIESAEKLQAAGIEDQDLIDTVKYHHERIDGSGYPFGLEGDDIPTLAKLVGVADTYVAMTTERAYRELLPSKVALREIFMMNKDPDAGLYGSFIKAMGIYPPGTFVLLNNGETAVVVERNLESSVKPIVKAVVSPKGARYPHPLKRKLAETTVEVFRPLTMGEIVSANWYELWDMK
ncbi:HD-GYP domain-containing protein [Pleionea sediminis]|uniref:HD-GYP domain-containing protein n=1 Tax=Pleionea sediminis TaxID=2569479 RepID=UPI001187220B|nr:HD domain-containing phosphohydrolase [Pleionea sediminis]